MTRIAFVFVGLMIVVVLLSSPARGDATQMYWLDWDSEILERANVDGSNRQVLLSGDLNKPRNVSLDLQAGKMYFCIKEKIGRANLDGSERELLVSIPYAAQHMALDLVGRKMYWSTTSPPSITRANLDGSNIETVISGPHLQLPNSLAIDNINGKMYWTNWSKDSINRANLDGSQSETLIDQGLGTPWDIELDIEGERMYWVNTPSPGGEIRSANFDGSDVRVVMHTTNPRNIALDMEAGKIYVANSFNIYVANLDGSGGMTLLSNIVPKGVALNVLPLLPESNTPPVADAGDDQTVFMCAVEMVEVKLDGSGSYDADGDELEYFWFEGDEQIATGVDPNVWLGVGEHIIELIVDDGTESSEPNEVVITVIEPIEADVHVVPRTINRRSRMKRVMAILQLPEGVSKHDIADEPFVLYPDESDDGIEAIWDRVIGRGNQATVFALFDKDELMAIVPGTGRVELTVVGRLESGQCIYGTDTVSIVRPRRRGRGLRRR